MANNPVLTLDSSGIIRGAEEKADALVAYFLGSQKSQSISYSHLVVSLPALIQEYGNSETSLAQETKMALTRYLSAYYDDVKIDVYVDDMKDSESKLAIRVFAELTQSGVAHQLGRMVAVANKRVSSITAIEYMA